MKSLAAIVIFAASALASDPEFLPNMRVDSKWAYSKTNVTPQMLPGFILPVYLSLPNRPFDVVGWILVKDGPVRTQEDNQLDLVAIRQLALSASAHGADALYVNPPNDVFKCYMSGTAIQWQKSNR